MSGNLWMFSDMLDDEDIEMQKHDFITLYQGADYYGLGLKSFTRMAREAGAVYKIGKKVLIRRTIFDEYLRKIYKKELQDKAREDSEKTLMMKQGIELLLSPTYIFCSRVALIERIILYLHEWNGIIKYSYME